MTNLMRATRLRRGVIAIAAAGLALSSVVLSTAASASVKLPSNGVEKPSGGTVTETGSTLLYPLFNLWTAQIQKEWPSVSIRRPHRLGYRHLGRRERHRQHRCLRRLPVTGGTSSNTRRSRTSRWRSRRSRSTTTSPDVTAHLKLDGPTARRHLPGQDHQVERRQDRGAEPGRDVARHPDRHRRTARTAPVTRSCSARSCAASDPSGVDDPAGTPPWRGRP